jgi:repressor of nif and glnA expression
MRHLIAVSSDGQYNQYPGKTKLDWNIWLSKTGYSAGFGPIQWAMRVVARTAHSRVPAINWKRLWYNCRFITGIGNKSRGRCHLEKRYARASSMDKKERNRTAILQALSGAAGPINSRRLAQLLATSGHQLSERTVRLYLNEMDAQGLTASRGRRGRSITEQGIVELRAAQTVQRVGYLSARIDNMTYGMTFDLATRTGLVVVNTSLVNPRQLQACVDKVCRVFERGYAMGNCLALLPSGDTLGDMTVPKDKVGVCTVCSITLNGVLLKHGVPTTSRFGGLLEMRNGQPTRFVEIIHYDGTSIDPLEVFIRSGMTNYLGAIADGNGLIGASFREIPQDSRELVLSLDERLNAIGLGGFMEIGMPGQPVLGLPISSGRIGSIMIGGLNPIAILEEEGHRVQSRALGGLLEFNRLFHFEELPKALKAYL